MTIRAVAAVALFASSVLAALLAPYCERDQVADALQWKAALAKNVDVVHAGDLVLVHPPWRDDVVRALRTIDALPRGVAITDALAPRHDDPLPAIVVVRERSGPPLPKVLRDRIDAGSVRVDGDFEFDRIAGSNEAAGFGAVVVGGGGRDLSNDLASAQVQVHKANGDVVDCPWDATRSSHVCTGLPAWMHVGVERLLVGGAPIECTWAHPITGGALVIEFASVPLSSQLTLELALTDGAADNTHAAAVSAALDVDGENVATLEHPPGKRGFVARTIDVAGAPKDAAVRLTITTPSDGQRHTCFRLTTTTATTTEKP